MMRSLRSLFILDNITINPIAPSATITKLLPSHLAKTIKTIGAPVSTALLLCILLGRKSRNE